MQSEPRPLVVGYLRSRQYLRFGVGQAGSDQLVFHSGRLHFWSAARKGRAAAVKKGGGTVLGSALYPFPGTSDFSALLLQAQASGAKVLALCNGGADTVASVKQAREFGLN